MRIWRTRPRIDPLRLLAFALGTAFLAPALAQTAETLAGKVELVEGEVRFLDRNQRPRTPKVDAPIYEGESIVTGPGGEVHLRMEDGGLIAARPDTKMRIVNFRAEGDANDRLVIGLLQGSFRSVTGWIAKFTRNNYTVRTSTATIGVRGTDHEPFHIPEGSKLGEPGTYDKVNQGGTFIQTKFGRVDVVPGRAGFASLRGIAKPQLLARIPAHFRATRHEERITRHYKENQQRLQQQRNDRRKQIEERRKKPGAQREERRKQPDEPHKKPGAQHEERLRKPEAGREHPHGKAERQRDAATKQRETAEKLRGHAAKERPAKERPARRDGRGDRE